MLPRVSGDNDSDSDTGGGKNNVSDDSTNGNAANEEATDMRKAIEICAQKSACKVLEAYADSIRMGRSI